MTCQSREGEAPAEPDPANTWLMRCGSAGARPPGVAIDQVIFAQSLSSMPRSRCTKALRYGLCLQRNFHLGDEILGVIKYQVVKEFLPGEVVAAAEVEDAKFFEVLSSGGHGKHCLQLGFLGVAA